MRDKHNISRLNKLVDLTRKVRQKKENIKSTFNVKVA